MDLEEAAQLGARLQGGGEELGRRVLSMHIVCIACSYMACTYLQRGGEELDRRVRDVVVRGDHAKVERCHLHPPFDREAASRLEISEGRLDELGEVVREMAVRGALQVVVVWVLRQPAVHEGPRQVVDCVLLRLDGLRDDLGAHVVAQEVVEVRLDGEGLVEELPVEGLLGGVAEQHAAADVVDERPPSLADHLDDIGDRVVDVPVLGAVVRLGVHQHYEVRWEGAQPPAEALDDDEDLERSGGIELADGRRLGILEALV